MLEKLRHLYLALLLLHLLSGVISAQGLDDSELLPQDEAFQFELMPVDPSAIQATWTIAGSYYMYRDKFKFAVDDAGYSLVIQQYPQGISKDDPLFGVTEVYEDEFSVLIDVTGSDGEFTLIAEGQGCNEPVGVCYAPITHNTRFIKTGQAIRLVAGETTPGTTAASPPVQAQQAKTGDVNLLRDLLAKSFSQPEFLRVEDAFKIENLSIDAQTVSGNFVVEPGYYLYRDKIGVMLGDKPLAVSIPQTPEKYEDPTFGSTDVYRTDFSFSANRPVD
ncbi:MAG: protein-disulfide reductase DsbD N-terminal domain-containing protein, partial [Gammaproteobacteria bacterium]|nr:protein-disulfide reductase DsbD N-terminal domain-containing protein [Gammaproteobacteria bacterium]